MNWDPTTRPAWQRYLGAILIVLITSGIRVEFLTALGWHAPFVLSYPSVILAALYGGFSAGLLATALAAFFTLLWLEPVGQFAIANPIDWLAIAIFVVSGVAISYLFESLFRAQARVKEAESEVRLALEREKSAHAVRESEERFRTLADNISQLAWMADEKGSIIWYNKRWYDYTGTTFEEMQGRGWTKVQHPEHVD
jgi:PAS domain-containing protein